MINRKDWFARLLNWLSGTYPNDERTSRINEKGFALIGFFYFFALFFRSAYALFRKYEFEIYPEWLLDIIILGIMVLIILSITIRLRFSEAAIQKKTHVKLRLTELPRAAAVMLSGKSPQDERIIHIYERAFAVCALIGFTYFGGCVLFLYLSRYFLSTIILLCTAPILLGSVKQQEKIMAPPRVLHIPLHPNNLLLRLPVYLLIVLPVIFLINYFPSLFDFIGEIDTANTYSDNLFIMFGQMVGDSIAYWAHEPWQITHEGWYHVLLFSLIVFIFHESMVWVYRERMQKMDTEENDTN